MNFWIILIPILVLIFLLALIVAYILPDEESPDEVKRRSERKPLLYAIATKELVDCGPGMVDEDSRLPKEVVERTEIVGKKLIISGVKEVEWN